MESLFQTLESYGQSAHYPFHMPGHKRQLTGDVLKDISKIDITEIDGFDNLHDACGIIEEAQKRGADFFHSKESFFLVNGSTAGILSSISACTQPGDWVLIARNCHKSVYHAAILNHLQVAYIYPDVDLELGFCKGISGEQVENAILEFSKQHSKEKLKAVLITSPTYEGILSEVKEIAEIVHKYGIPLIVDEAHGSHLGIHKDLPPNSCTQGADLVIHSLHKTLPAMTQCAVLHLNGTLVKKERLKRYLSMFQTSSPSYILMASIDETIQKLKLHGSEEFEDFFHKRKALLQKLDKLQKIYIYETPVCDPCKLVISTRGTNLTGRTLYKLLLEKYKLQMEMAAGDYVLGILTISDTWEGFDRLSEALLELDHMAAYEHSGSSGIFKKTVIAQSYTSMENALDHPSIGEKLENTIGMISARFVNAYPPGTPILVPGERIQQEQIHEIRFLLEKGIQLQGIEQGDIKVLQLENG